MDEPAGYEELSNLPEEDDGLAVNMEDNSLAVNMEDNSLAVNMEEEELPEMIKEENDELMRHILQDKRGEPNKYASYWEADEEDVEHWSEKDIEDDPVKMMLWAAENGKHKIISKLAKSSPELVNARDTDGYTPLHRAAYGGHCKAADLLVSLGADVMARTNDGWTPLHSAAHWDHWEMCELLLNLGAEPNAVTEGGNTPLHVACVQCQTPRTVAFLLRWPHLRLDMRNAQGDTPKDICERRCSFSKELFG